MAKSAFTHTDSFLRNLVPRADRPRTVLCVLFTVVESQFQTLLEQTEREDTVPQAVRHYLQEMAELTELAKERLDQIKV